MIDMWWLERRRVWVHAAVIVRSAIQKSYRIDLLANTKVMTFYSIFIGRVLHLSVQDFLLFMESVVILLSGARSAYCLYARRSKPISTYKV